ncbi:MAG: 1-acyl-sn-glycerol-3-phosphate acyltransferase [Muribaculaceae bacterium]|nr:1-acyl-sn-glycerol-3-phosphate acyltransferase [Muribaculaceae bacterium]
MAHTEDKILQLDVNEVLRSKMPRYYRYIPKFLISKLRKIICQDGLNDLLSRFGNLKGADFSDALINDLDIKLNIEGIENIPQGNKLIFVSNHPLGALDGIALISFLGKRYPDKFKFLVNDILLAIPTYADIFLPINKHGKQSREAALEIESAFSGDFAIATFPAGLCSRDIGKGEIKDLKWNKNFIAKSKEFQRDVVPIYFKGQNSSFFYRLAKIRKQIGLKINIEMIYLPSEIFKGREKEYTIRIGNPISWKNFDNSHTLDKWASIVKDSVYRLDY